MKGRIKTLDKSFSEIIGKAFIDYSKNGNKAKLNRRINIARINFKGVGK